MNADVVRQRIAASGKLFDVAGNSSVGNLPQGKLIIKSANYPLAQFPQNDVHPNYTVGSAPFPHSEEERKKYASNQPAVALNANSPFKLPPDDEGQNFLFQGAVNPV